MGGWSEVHFRDLKIKKCSGEEGRFGLLLVDSNDLKRLKILFLLSSSCTIIVSLLASPVLLIPELSDKIVRH